MCLGVFEGAELESAAHLPRNLIGWPTTNRNSAAKKNSQNHLYFRENDEMGFLEAVRSNLGTIRLSILSVDRKPIGIEFLRK